MEISVLWLLWPVIGALWYAYCPEIFYEITGQDKQYGYEDWGGVLAVTVAMALWPIIILAIVLFVLVTAF